MENLINLINSQGCIEVFPNKLFFLNASLMKPTINPSKFPIGKVFSCQTFALHRIYVCTNMQCSVQ